MVANKKKGTKSNKITKFVPKIQTFTYYIPAPPKRSSGYREKQFDNICFQLLNRGYKVLSITTTANTGVNGSGMWVLFLLESTNANSSINTINDIIFDESKDDIVLELSSLNEDV